MRMATSRMACFPRKEREVAAQDSRSSGHRFKACSQGLEHIGHEEHNENAKLIINFDNAIAPRPIFSFSSAVRRLAVDKWIWPMSSPVTFAPTLAAANEITPSPQPR